MMLYIVLEDRFPLQLLLVGKMYFWVIFLKKQIKIYITKICLVEWCAMMTSSLLFSSLSVDFCFAR